MHADCHVAGGDEVVPPETIGEIAVKGPVVTAEYFGDEATAAGEDGGSGMAGFIIGWGIWGISMRRGGCGFAGGSRSGCDWAMDGAICIGTPVEAIFNTHPVAVRRSALVGVKVSGETCADDLR